MKNDLHNNIRLYPLYQIATSFIPWLPIFFLYFNQYVSLGDALIISSAYYFCVFLLEIPSGYLSDRFGRKPILLASCLSAIAAYTLFLFADDLRTLIIAQSLLAGFFSLKSGSDTSLLYDSLHQLERQDEYSDQEANAAKLSMLSLAASGLIGGISAYFNLHLAYVLSLVAAIAGLLICVQFKEPEKYGKPHSFFKQLGVCLNYLKSPLLLWIFFYFVVAYSLEHIPAEFNQPYVKLLQSNWFGDSDLSTIVSGIVVAVSMLAGAIAAAFSMRLLKLLGLKKLMIFSLSIQTVIVAGMSVVLHPIVLLLVMCRNFCMALTHAPMLGAIAPLIETNQRATFLSIQSLAGRLGFALALFGLSSLTGSHSSGGDAMNWIELSSLLRLSLLVAIVTLVALVIASRHLEVKDAKTPE